jgi:26S proteasome regulatory subunit N11
MNKTCKIYSLVIFHDYARGPGAKPLYRQCNGRGGAGPVAVADTGEQIYVSSLALLKMLKHSRAGIPFEVMGLMVGEIHDDYTITVVDVFSMP